MKSQDMIYIILTCKLVTLKQLGLHWKFQGNGSCCNSNESHVSVVSEVFCPDSHGLHESFTGNNIVQFCWELLRCCSIVMETVAQGTGYKTVIGTNCNFFWSFHSSLNSREPSTPTLFHYKIETKICDMKKEWNITLKAPSYCARYVACVVSKPQTTTEEPLPPFWW